MSRDWRTICRFAGLGVALVGVSCLYLVTDPLAGSSTKNSVAVVLSYFCPGSLVFYVDVEQMT